MRKYPYTAYSGNQYLMIIYLVDAHVILVARFKNKIRKMLIELTLNYKKDINNIGFKVNMHILDNEAADLCRDTIEVSNSKY